MSLHRCLKNLQPPATTPHMKYFYSQSKGAGNFFVLEFQLAPAGGILDTLAWLFASLEKRLWKIWIFDYTQTHKHLRTLQ